MKIHQLESRRELEGQAILFSVRVFISNLSSWMTPASLAASFAWPSTLSGGSLRGIKGSLNHSLSGLSLPFRESQRRARDNRYIITYFNENTFTFFHFPLIFFTFPTNQINIFLFPKVSRKDISIFVFENVKKILKRLLSYVIVSS